MPRRPARCYTRVAGPPYTRRKYVRSVPGSKITSFESGNKNTEFPVTVSLYAKEACQIRHVSLESCRMMTNRHMQKRAGTDNYHLIVRVFPHHILRENKMMAFAGADRLQDGMRRSFGKPMDVAARVKADQIITTIHTYPQFVDKALRALKIGGDKLPTTYTIRFDKGEEAYKEYLLTTRKE